MLLALEMLFTFALAIGLAIDMVIVETRHRREEKARALAEAQRLAANATYEHAAILRGNYRYGMYGRYPPTTVR